MDGAVWAHWKRKNYGAASHRWFCEAGCGFDCAWRRGAGGLCQGCLRSGVSAAHQERWTNGSTVSAPDGSVECDDWSRVGGEAWRGEDVVEEMLRLFRLEDLADRMPRDLSGGEKQRASVVRAVISAITFDGPGTALLLLDEPFSGLDNAMRDDLLVDLRECLGRWKMPVLSVTHDVGEAFQLGAEVIKIGDGRVIQQGPVATVLAEERAPIARTTQRSGAKPSMTGSCSS